MIFLGVVILVFKGRFHVGLMLCLVKAVVEVCQHL